MNRETLTTISDFFTWRFADLAADERIEIRSFPSGGGAARQSWHRTPADAARAVLARPSDHHVFYGVNARRDRGGKKEDVTKIRGLWADQDFKHYGGADATGAERRAGADAARAALPLPPTAVIESGNGYHLYWQFAAPIEPAGGVEPLLARLYAALGGLDSVQDVARVFRVPLTLNHKSDPPRRAAITVADTGARYTLSDFLALLPEPEPAPARPSWTPPTGGTHAANRDEPTRGDIREWLRWIAPTGDYKDHWVKVLAAVHSVYPGADGVALCEAWSPGKPGEIARKFASFKRPAGGAGAAGVGTLIYLAQAGGWQPARATRAPLPTGDGADIAAEVIRLRAELAAAERRAAQAERLLSFCQGEHQRKDRRIAELEASVSAYTAALTHPDPTVGGSAFDITDAALAGFSGGDTVVVDGLEYGRVVCKQAAKTKSAPTIGRAIRKIKEGGEVPIFYRKERIETDNYRGDTEIAYVHIPPEIRQSRAATALYLLPSNAVKKQGGARVRTTVPTSEKYPDAPVKRVTARTDLWYSLVDNECLDVQKRPDTVAYFTAAGEDMTTADALTYQETTGARVATKAPPAYHPPAQQPLSAVDRELIRPPLDRAAFDHWLDEDEPAPIPIPITDRRCRAGGCGRAPLPDGWCENHAAILSMAAGD